MIESFTVDLYHPGKHRQVKRVQMPTYVMICVGISAEGRTPLIVTLLMQKKCSNLQRTGFGTGS